MNKFKKQEVATSCFVVVVVVEALETTTYTDCKKNDFFAVMKKNCTFVHILCLL